MDGSEAFGPFTELALMRANGAEPVFWFCVGRESLAFAAGLSVIPAAGTLS